MKNTFISLLLILVLISSIQINQALESEPSKWFIESIEQLKKENQLDERLFSSYHEKISRKDFAYLGVRLYEIYTGLTVTNGESAFTDTSDEWVLKAKHLGIVNGYSDGSFKPNQAIRRDELAHLFVNVMKIAKTRYQGVGKITFNDDSSISSWAKDSVYIAKENGLVGGVGNNQFNPSGNATREEALIIFYRGIHSTFIRPVKAVRISDKKFEASFLTFKKYWPDIITLYDLGYLKSVVSQTEKGTMVLEFDIMLNSVKVGAAKNFYFVWNIQGLETGVSDLEGDYWIVKSPIVKGTVINYTTQIQPSDRLSCSSKGSMIHEGPKQSPVIERIELIGDEKNKPWIVENSDGDLWFSTWADDDNLYTSWGDGRGFVDKSKQLTDLGIGLLTGTPKSYIGNNLYVEVVPSSKEEAHYVDDKPSSLLYLNNGLVGHFHRPLEDPLIGYLAVSKDFGITWEKLMESPWTKENQSSFRCMFFINQGKNYSLNQDGYVYAFGIGKEWGWNGDVFLTRVKANSILDYSAYEYMTDLNIGSTSPIWSSNQKKAIAIPGIIAYQQFSAIYHPGVKRYIAMTNQFIFDAPNPWGPWTISGEWLQPGWLGYQPGIIPKDIGTQSFWFTESGQPWYGDELPYKLCTGQIRMILKQ